MCTLRPSPPPTVTMLCFCSYLFPCGSVMSWRLAQAVNLPSPNENRNRLQQTPMTPELGYEKRMNAIAVNAPTQDVFYSAEGFNLRVSTLGEHQGQRPSVPLLGGSPVMSLQRRSTSAHKGAWSSWQAGRCCCHYLQRSEVISVILRCQLLRRPFEFFCILRL